MMNRFTKLVLLGLLVNFQIANAQQTPCGTDEYWNQQKSKNPALEKARQQADLYAESIKNAAFKTVPDTQVLTIPIVFHIISTASHPVKTNLSNCLDQIKRLNEDYSATNADTSNIRRIFKSRLGDAHIRFFLATKDPQGNPTTGITYDTSILTYQANDSVKSVIDWDHNFYLNVWVVSTINSGSATPGTDIAGYSTFPWDGLINSKTDGIVIDHTWVGYGTDRTLSHETGHFLGLYHTFQDGCKGGDQVDDTPPVAAANLGKCSSWPSSDTTINTCHNDAPDLPDMLENIMDYASCKVMFTQGQVTRMRGFLTTNRVSLYNNNNVAGIQNAAAINTAAISIYPNPATQNFVLEASGLTPAKTIHFKCYDMMGRLQFDETAIADNEGNLTKQLDAGNLIPGVFKITIYEGNEMKAVKALVKD